MAFNTIGLPLITGNRTLTSGVAPIALGNEIRGGIHRISGQPGDTLADIRGTHLQAGMLVYDGLANKYFMYRNVGDPPANPPVANDPYRDANGRLPNNNPENPGADDSNWIEFLEGQLWNITEYDYSDSVNSPRLFRDEGNITAGAGMNLGARVDTERNTANGFCSISGSMSKLTEEPYKLEQQLSWFYTSALGMGYRLSAHNGAYRGNDPFIIDVTEPAKIEQINGEYIESPAVIETTLKHLVDPVEDGDATNKKYVDDKVSQVMTFSRSPDGSLLLNVTDDNGVLVGALTIGASGHASFTANHSFGIAAAGNSIGVSEEGLRLNRITFTTEELQRLKELANS